MSVKIRLKMALLSVKGGKKTKNSIHGVAIRIITNKDLIAHLFYG